jgi:hypothetical protein
MRNLTPHLYVWSLLYIQSTFIRTSSPATRPIFLQYPPSIPKLLLRLIKPALLSLPNSLVYPQHLRLDLVSLEGKLVTLFLRWPEAWDGEAVLEVRAEVVHPPDGECEVHAELQESSVSRMQRW